jgi:hypothetical protein
MRGEASRLHALRILIGGYALVYTAARLPELWAIARLPASQFEGTGLAQLALPPAVVMAIGGATIALLGAFVVGWRYRITAPLAAFGLVVVFSYRSAWGQVFHTENLLVLHVIALAMAPADRRDDGAGDHAWWVKLLGALTVLTYVMAGIAKLRLAGMAWLDGDQLRNQIAIDNLRKALLGARVAPLGGPLLEHGGWLMPVSVATLVVELAAPVALLGRQFAVVWITLAWAFHVGVLLFMWIVFPYPLLGFAFLPLIPAETLLPRKLRL